MTTVKDGSQAKQIRHGEVLLLRVDALPPTAALQPAGNIVRKGSEQGYDHVLLTDDGKPLDDAIYNEDDSNYYIAIPDGTTATIANRSSDGGHGRHDDISGLHGVYRVVIHEINDPYHGVRQSRD